MSDYKREFLDAESAKIFRALRESYKRGHCVGYYWFLRVSNHGASLVVPYQTKDEVTGEWSGMNEYVEAL